MTPNPNVVKRSSCVKLDVVRRPPFSLVCYYPISTVSSSTFEICSQISFMVFSHCDIVIISEKPPESSSDLYSFIFTRTSIQLPLQDLFLRFSFYSFIRLQVFDILLIFLTFMFLLLFLSFFVFYNLHYYRFLKGFNHCLQFGIQVLRIFCLSSYLWFLFWFILFYFNVGGFFYFFFCFSYMFLFGLFLFYEWTSSLSYFNSDLTRRFCYIRSALTLLYKFCNFPFFVCG